MKLKQKPAMEIRDNEYYLPHGDNRKVRQLTISLYDLKLTTDINDDRDLSLAKRLADDFGVKLMDFTK